MRVNMILANNNMWRDLRAQGSRIYIIFNIQSDRNKGFTDHEHSMFVMKYLIFIRRAHADLQNYGC